LNAQLLEWQSWAHWLGLKTNIRLEQLTSTLDKPATRKDQATTTSNSNSYRLSRNPGISLWDLQQQYPERLRILRTQALQTDSYPLQNSMRFHIYLSDGALTARTINRPKAKAATRLNTPVINYRGTSGPGGASSSSADATESTPELEDDVSDPPPAGQ
jgi:hypothetical protein